MSQIIYSGKYNRWFLLDFGHAEVTWTYVFLKIISILIHFREPANSESAEFIGKISASDSVGSSDVEFSRLFNYFWKGNLILIYNFEIKLQELKHLKSEIKSRRLRRWNLR
jgi:hypothetical protein